MKASSCWPIVGLALLVGCGGGGGGTVTSGADPVPPAAPVASAKFSVDARTGEVKIEPINIGRAAFSGNSLSFTSSLLLAEGTPQRRILRVTAKNNTAEAIGSSGSMRVVFGSFQNNNAPLTDLRSTVQVSTVWGNGTAEVVPGPIGSAKIANPEDVSFDQASNRTFATAGPYAGYSQYLLQADEGFVSAVFGRNLMTGLASGPGFQLIGGKSFVLVKTDDQAGISSVIGSIDEGSNDGTFETARFHDIHDVSITRASGPNDFDAVVADDLAVRQLSVRPNNPAGSVQTITYTFTTCKSAVMKDNYVYAVSLSHILVYSDGAHQYIGSFDDSGYADGVQESARFNDPNRIRFIGNCLFVADTGNNRIRQLTLRPGALPTSPKAWWVSTLSGSGAAFSADGTGTAVAHNGPFGLSQGPGESLFVADKNGHKIRKITPISGRFMSEFGDGTINPIDKATLANPTDYTPGSPTRDPFIEESKTIPAGGSLALSDWQFTLPADLKAFSFTVTVEAETASPGVLPAALNSLSGSKGSPNVLVRGYAGGEQEGYADGPVSMAAFNDIRGLCRSEDGTMFVADKGNNCIRRISSSGVVSTIAGSPLGAAMTIDGAGSIATVRAPLSIDCSPDGKEVYFTQADEVVRAAVWYGYGDPTDKTSWTIFTIAGESNASGKAVDCDGASARFATPTDVVYAAPKTLYVVDSMNNNIKVLNHLNYGWSKSDFMVQVLSGSPESAAGTTDSASGKLARFSAPVKAALLPTKMLLVTDSLNCKVRMVSPTGATSSLSGSGIAGYKDGLSALSAQYKLPFGIAAEPSGYAYVGDSYNYVVRRVSPTGLSGTVAGSATAAGSTDGSGLTSLFTSAINDMCVAKGGDLYVADGNRVRLIQRVIGS